MKYRRNAYLYCCLLPSFVLIGIFLLYPSYEAIRISFLDWNMSDYMNPQYIGLDNYVDVLTDPIFGHSFIVLLGFMIWALVVYQGTSIVGAYLIYLLGNSRIARFFKVAFTVPMVLPGMVVTLFWLFFYEPNSGMLNYLLTAIGLEHWTAVWLGQSQWTAMGAIMMKGFPWISGMGFLIYLAGFQTIDDSLKEAARIDGANGWIIFTRINLLLLMPQIRLTTILVIIGGIQQFSDQLIMTNGGPGFDTTVPGLFMFNQAFSYGQLGIGSTIGVILFVIIILFTALNLRLLRERT